MEFTLDVLIVAYRPVFDGLEKLLNSLAIQEGSPFVTRLAIIDNSCDAATLAGLRKMADSYAGRFGAVQVLAAERNLGFGAGMNRLFRATQAQYVLVLNQDAWLASDALAVLARQVRDDQRVAAWELRQVPYEHPKAYDPVTLETPWVSAAACLFRRDAFAAAGGFEERIFMYAEDVDLSWRLRCNGWILRYVPKAVAVHRSYRYPNEVKVAQVFGGTMTNLCLRARYGTWRDIFTGVRMLAREVLVPPSFPGRRWGLLKNLLIFPWKLRGFRRGAWRDRPGFHPVFNGWDFETRRDGDFYEFPEPGSWRDPPLVSILIRTHRRPQWLREALRTVAHQTYPNIEAVVVEDGPPVSRDMIEKEFAPILNVRYFATGENVGRARAGNLALAQAHGEWFNFLDDDDVLFADHVEVLMTEALRRGVLGVYGLAWETPTRVLAQDPLRYEEVGIFTRYREEFNRITLGRRGFIPIQALLFHRSLYERYGGFAEDMSQLEDWNLETRYTLRDDFSLVHKTTSKYRVPADSDSDAEALRQQALREAYADAVKR